MKQHSSTDEFVHGYSLDTPGAESEFLLRELGIRWKQVPSDVMTAVAYFHARRCTRMLLIVRSCSALHDLLALLPPQSVVVLLVSDETLCFGCTRALRDESVAAIFHQYSYRLAPIRTVLRHSLSLMQEGDSRSKTDAVLVLRSFLIGLRHRFRITLRRILWAGKRTVKEIPLGYTNQFARAFVERGHVTETGSLLQAELKAELGAKSLASFEGQAGQIQRRMLLKAIAGMRGVQVLAYDTEWLGETSLSHARRYVRRMCQSQFVIAPPGWRCNESFRVMEALLCGAVPITSACSIAQQTSSIHTEMSSCVVQDIRNLKRTLSTANRVDLWRLHAALTRNLSQHLDTNRAQIRLMLLSGTDI